MANSCSLHCLRVLSPYTGTRATYLSAILCTCCVAACRACAGISAYLRQVFYALLGGIMAYRALPHPAIAPLNNRTPTLLYTLRAAAALYAHHLMYPSRIRTCLRASYVHVAALFSPIATAPPACLRTAAARVPSPASFASAPYWSLTDAHTHCLRATSLEGGIGRHGD